MVWHLKFYPFHSTEINWFLIIFDTQKTLRSSISCIEFSSDQCTAVDPITNLELSALALLKWGESDGCERTPLFC